MHSTANALKEWPGWTIDTPTCVSFYLADPSFDFSMSLLELNTPPDDTSVIHRSDMEAQRDQRMWTA